MTGWSLAAISIGCGLAIAFVFQRTTDAAAIRATRKRIVAHLLEFRLYAGEPRLILGAQWGLIRENLRWMRLLIRPALILLVPVAWLMLELEGIYGARPLEPGQAALVTAQLRRDLRPVDAASTLEAPSGIVVETAPVRVFAERQISWRIRPIGPARGRLRLAVGGQRLERSVAAGERGLFLTRRYWFWPIPPGEVAWVEVNYPPAHWLGWFLAISGASSLGFSRWFRRSG